MSIQGRCFRVKHLTPNPTEQVRLIMALGRKYVVPYKKRRDAYQSNS